MTTHKAQAQIASMDAWLRGAKAGDSFAYASTDDLVSPVFNSGTTWDAVRNHAYSLWQRGTVALFQRRERHGESSCLTYTMVRLTSKSSAWLDRVSKSVDVPCPVNVARRVEVLTRMDKRMRAAA